MPTTANNETLERTMNTFPYIILLKGKLKLKLADGTILDIENPELVTEEMFPLFTDITYEYPWPGTWEKIEQWKLSSFDTPWQIAIPRPNYSNVIYRFVARLIAPEQKDSVTQLKDSGEWRAVPAKKIPMAERLENISRKLKARHATTVIELDLMEAYQLGQNPEPVSSETQEELWKELIDIYDTTDRHHYGYGGLINNLSKRFIITRKS